MRTYSSGLKITANVTLAFFLWSFGPVYAAVAWAAEPRKSEVRSQESGGKQKAETRQQTPGDRFEKALEEIREKVGKAEEKVGRGEAATEETEAIKTRKAEVDALDVDLRNEFAQTEKKLKDAKLPQEILDRHYKFVKHYEANLSELKANIDGIEKAGTKADRKAKIEKAKAHLEKTKKPSIHQKLDPNRLPHQNRVLKTKWREPRTKDQYERDFPQQKTLRPGSGQASSKQKIADSRSWHDLLANAPKQKPILLAFNEFASDIPLSLGAQSATPQLAFSDPSPFLLAQAADQPSADDLAETPDVQFTDAIRAKAQELGGKPLKIYEWVRNNIEYAPTYGSIQGADMCLQSRICNDTDTASLLIALLRVSGIYSHYVYSTIEIPIDKAMNLVGGVTDPKMVGTILATNGIPAKMLISGGTYKAVQLEHVYVSAFIDYIPSRGAVHKQGDTFIPLDPSYKQYSYTQGIDIKTAVPFDAQSFANHIQSTATINPDGSVTSLNSALVQQTMQDYQAQVQSYIQQNFPNATVGDVIGKKEIKKQELGILPVTLPYKIVQAGTEFAQVPDNLCATISFSIPDQAGMGTGLSYHTSLPQTAGKKITLSFSPATVTDQAVIESYLPKPHTDGTPIQPSELPSSLPAYLINLKPELRIDGQIVASGSAITMGAELSFTISLNEPGIGPSQISNTILAGEYYGIGLDTGRMANLSSLKAKLDNTKAKIDSLNFVGLNKDDLIGDLLYTTVASYFTALDVSDEIAARSHGVIRYRAPSVGMFSLLLDVRDVFGIPTSASSKGLMMDIDRIMQAVFSVDGNADKVVSYMLASGRTSSALEHFIPEKLYSTPNEPAKAISAVKALQIANSQGMPIYTINKSNITVVLPQLQVGNDVKSTISDAVNAGKIVTVSKGNIAYEGWVGCGYIIIDATTGAGAYLISGQYSGACLILLWAAQLLLTILLPFTAPIWIVLAPILGAFIAVAGQYLINSTVNPNTPVVTGTQLTGVYLDIVVSSILSYAISLLPLMSLAGPLGLILFAFFMLLIAVVDWVAFFYITYNFDSMRYLARYRADLKG